MILVPPTFAVSPLDMAWVTDPLDEITSLYSGTFVAWGTHMLWLIAGIVIILYAAKHGLTGGLFRFCLQYVPLVLLAANVLRYYDTPLPHTSLSVHQLFPSLATELGNTIDQARLSLMFGKVGLILSNMKQPGIGNMAALPVYWLVELFCWVIQALLFGAIAIGYVALGVGNLLGPLFIPWLVVPRVSFLFWNWLQFTMEYSFYKVVAAALSFIWSTTINTFIDRTVGLNYDLAHFAVIMPKMMVIMVAMTWSVLRVTALVADLFKGTSSGGSNMLTGIAAGAKGRPQ